MQIQANITGTSLQQFPRAAESVESGRKELEEVQADLEKSSSSESSSVQPEEILNQIKSLTEDGLFSIRFEKSPDSEDLIIKVVNSETGDLIRQVPAESVLGSKTDLEGFVGQVINTVR